MMKYDELIKSLKICADDLALSCNGCIHDNTTELHCKFQLMKEATDAIEELSKPRWIPVTEQLPEDLTRVIVFCEDGVSYGLCERLIADGAEVVEWHDFLHYPITPTHWMPLPEPPKEETGGANMRSNAQVMPSKDGET